MQEEGGGGPRTCSLSAWRRSAGGTSASSGLTWASCSVSARRSWVSPSTCSKLSGDTKSMAALMHDFRLRTCTICEVSSQ